jgi:membrane fusion protein (multidrug efflux system)
MLALTWPGPSRAQDGPGVITAEAKRLSFPLTVEAVGTARARESIEVRPKTTERVTAIRFSEGQHVDANAVLVELGDAEARAAVAAARARLVDSQAKHARGKDLFENHLISESELESLSAQRDADQAALDAAEARLADTVVRAPFAGYVGLRRVSMGALVSPAVIITTLDDTDTIKLDFDIPETVLSLVGVGFPVIARSAAWPEHTFEGSVSSIDTRVDPVSRTVTVRALVPNRDLLLRPGMFLTVELLRPDVTALLVPEQAIVPEQSRQFVLVVGDDNVVEKREVQIGRRRPGAVEIVGGLDAGEVVVAEGTQKALPGSTVNVVGTVEIPE